jgi:serine-protein kinase ATM
LPPNFLQVLEWVEETVAFGDCICDKGTKKSGYSLGTHSKYYPGEYGSSYCRQILSAAMPDSKRKVFDDICKNFSPSFRFFFVDRFGDCLAQWHQAKMRYTRSVAVNSIVGHILGIGDRHVSNILVHEKTGEVIHIDFGIVFEQGKVSYNNFGSA